MTETTATPAKTAEPDVIEPETVAPEEATPTPDPTAQLAEFEARLRAEWPGPHNTTTGEYFVAPEVSVGGWAEALILQAAQVAGEVFLGLDGEQVIDGAEGGE